MLLAERAGVEAGDDLAYGSLGAAMRAWAARRRRGDLPDGAPKGHDDVRLPYGSCLDSITGREADAEAAHRQALAHGDDDAHLNLASHLSDQGRDEEAEFRNALEAGDEMARMPYAVSCSMPGTTPPGSTSTLPRPTATRMLRSSWPSRTPGTRTQAAPAEGPTASGHPPPVARPSRSQSSHAGPPDPHVSRSSQPTSRSP